MSALCGRSKARRRLCHRWGNAVAAWVATVDAGAVRNTRDVDILVERGDLTRAQRALEEAGFVHRSIGALQVFLQHEQAADEQYRGRRVDEAIHLLFANEPVRPGDLLPSPDLSSAQPLDEFVISLEALLQMKLSAYRDKDRVHLRDLLGVGLLGPDWSTRIPSQPARPAAAHPRHLR